MEDEEYVLCDLDLDTEEAIVQAVDGVIINGDDDEVKLLFYYIKPSNNGETADIIKGKCVAEFRVSRTKFLEIATDISFCLSELILKKNRYI